MAYAGAHHLWHASDSTQLDAVAMGAPRPTQVALTSPVVVAMSKDVTL